MPVSVFRQGARRREPFPYDLIVEIEGTRTGLMCAQPKAEKQKPADLGQVTPPAFSESGQNPILVKAHSFGPMPLGMGLRKQAKPGSGEDEQYSHCLAADWSSGVLVKGPDIFTVTPPTTDSTNGGTAPPIEVDDVLYFPMGRYILKRTGDDAAAFTVSLDLGIGNKSYDSAAFASNALSAEYGWIAAGDSVNLYYLTGGTWTQHASLKARAFARTGREFYRAHTTNTLTKVDTDADPTNAANWGNEFSFTAGDKAHAINRMGVTASGRLVIVKEDGCYALKGATDPDDPGGEEPLFPHLRLVPDADNGKSIANHGDELFVGFQSSGFWKIDATGDSIAPCGPELLLDNGSEVRGWVTACVGTPWGLYGAFYNPDTQDSYICVYKGTYEKNGRQVPIWHGSISAAFTDEKITTMTRSAVGADARHSRVYFTTSLGRIGWWQLSCMPNPADCSDYGFTTGTSEAHLPTWTGGFNSEVKGVSAWSATQRAASGDAYVQLQYRLDSATGAYSLLGTNFTADQQKADFPAATAATQLDQKIVLLNATAADTPQVQSVAVHHRLQTDLKQVHSYAILCEDNLTDRNGVPLRIGQREIRERLEAAASPDTSPGSITATLPTEESKAVAVVAYAEQMAWDDRSRQLRSVIPVQLIEVRDVQTDGLWQDAEALGTWAAAEAYATWSDIENL